MSASEAFVETLVAHGVRDVFGLVGSAFMDALDLFPAAGLRFWPVAHEQNAAHMADGYARATGRTGVCIAQNGPGVTNFVTGVAAAYWAHSPLLVVTPESAAGSRGLGGFQEVDQAGLFRPVVKWQADVNLPSRLAELTGRALDAAQAERGPVQLNVPRDFFAHQGPFRIPRPRPLQVGPGGPDALDRAASLLAQARRPVLLAGYGAVTSPSGHANVQALAEFLHAPVCTTYLHPDAFPAGHELWAGALGYNGSKAAMRALQGADVVGALGSRLGPFGTLPQYGLSYWPSAARLVQADSNPRHLGLTRPADVPLLGDAGLAAGELLARLRALPPGAVASAASKDERARQLRDWKAQWEAELSAASLPAGPPAPPAGEVRPRAALRALEASLPPQAMVATDVGNVCSAANSFLRFSSPRSFFGAGTFGNCGIALPAAMGAKVAQPERPSFAYVGDGAWGMSLHELLTAVRERIGVTAFVFNNSQWGAEKKNQVLWYADRYVGSNLTNPSFSAIARTMGARGEEVHHVDEIPGAVARATAAQQEGIPTVVEIFLSRELGEPFRRDAMKCPQRLLPKYAHLSVQSESPTGQVTDMERPPPIKSL